MNDVVVFSLALNGEGGYTEASDTDNPNWVHLDCSLGNAEQPLVGMGLEPRVAESMVRSDTRPRTVTTEDGLLVVLRGVNTNPGADPEDMVSLRMWIERDRLITVRQRKLLSIQDVREQLQEGRGARDVAGLVLAIVERLADRVSDFVEGIEEQLSGHEASVEHDNPVTLRREVTALRRQAAVVRRFLAPQRDALETWYRLARNMFDDDQMFYLREQSDRMTRYVEDLDLARERMLVVQEELMNRIAQEQNSRMYVLSLVAAVFLPITFVTGLFGMNVAGLPGTEDESSFWLLSGVLLLTSLVVVLAFKLKRWF